MKILKNMCLASALILILISSNVKAAWILGVGTESCGEVLSAINEEKQSGLGMDLVETVYMVWAQGYISAINYYNDSDKGQYFENPEELTDLVINTCEQNTEQYFIEAVDYVYENYL